MGFTHYWTVVRKPSRAEWEELGSKILKIVDWARCDCVKLEYVRLRDVLTFSDTGALTEEPFRIPRSSTAVKEHFKARGEIMELCVCTALLLADKVLKDKIIVTSDLEGGHPVWARAREIYTELYNEPSDADAVKESVVV